MYLGLPFRFMVLLAFPSSRRILPVIGLLVLCGAILLSSFANTTTELLVSQGVLYAVGGCTTYAPTILFLDEWFVQKKGLVSCGKSLHPACAVTHTSILISVGRAGAGTAGVVCTPRYGRRIENVRFPRCVAWLGLDSLGAYCANAILHQTSSTALTSAALPFLFPLRTRLHGLPAG